jgi:3-hydroxyacyl-CoA dehydrogenase
VLLQVICMINKQGYIHMQQPLVIKKIAVLGAGVMGAQIAAHCANAGITTLLYDLPAQEKDKNTLVQKAIYQLTKLKPSPLGAVNTIQLLQAKNYENDLSDLRTCDLIIEAIAEKIEWKRALFAQITSFINEKAILVTNTSGLSINSLQKELPEQLRARFCGVHFFNPPRYMHLAELIAGDKTSPQLLDQLEGWLTSGLGKGVVRAKDTPNFIANRIGVFSLLATLYHAEQFNLGFDEVDALTGILIGRPKSATCRTMDVVGLDTMAHVVNTMAEQLPEDPWHSLYKLPDWLLGLINQGALGQKAGRGIYRKNENKIEVYDVKQQGYREAKGAVSPDVMQIMKIADPQERMQQLFNGKDKQAQFLSACLSDLFQYAAFHAADIADTVREIDLAMRWGFGWQYGPFETWQAAGTSLIKENLNQRIMNKAALANISFPAWLQQVESFYTSQGAFNANKRAYEQPSGLPVYKKQLFRDSVIFEAPKHTKPIYQNSGVELRVLEEDIFTLNFTSKANSISQSVLEGVNEALDYAEKHAQGVIFYQWDPSNFSAGADLRAVSDLIKERKYSALEHMIQSFQQLVMRVKYNSVPTIAALRGRALGGGCELLLHCSCVMAAFEAYPGLVEVGVGLIPAGGGCKEMALRAAKLSEKGNLMDWIQPYFEQIAMGLVSGSAKEAQDRGYLRVSDTWVMNKDEVLFAAVAKIKAMRAANYLPEIPHYLKVAGREGHARLQIGLVNWLEGGFISQHDYLIANNIAAVLCGGNVDQNSLVDENWLLKLELEAFISLASTPESEARINHMLETGKPLRN